MISLIFAIDTALDNGIRTVNHVIGLYMRLQHNAESQSHTVNIAEVTTKGVKKLISHWAGPPLRHFQHVVTRIQADNSSTPMVQ